MLFDVFEWMEQVVKDLHHTKKSSSSGSGRLTTTSTYMVIEFATLRKSPGHTTSVLAGNQSANLMEHFDLARLQRAH